MKLVHLVGFITEKFVTIHGHTNVKICFLWPLFCVPCMAQVGQYILENQSGQPLVTFTSSQASFCSAYDVPRGFISFPFSSHYLTVCSELCTFCQNMDIYLCRPLSQVLSQIGFCPVSAVGCQKVLCSMTRSDCLTVVYFLICQS